MYVVDDYGRRWQLPLNEVCYECGQPDNIGDCNHAPLSPADVTQLGGKLEGEF
jgi:hypothetical protein